VLVGQRAATAAEIGIERREVAFALVAIAAAGVGLPDFDQRVGHRAGVFVEHLTVDDDALTDGVAAVLAVVADEVVVELADRAMAKGRAAGFRRGLAERQQCMTRRAEGGALISGREGGWMPGAVALEQRSIGSG